MNLMKITLVFLLAAANLSAGGTRTWLQGDQSDFEKGHLHGLSLRSDGRLTLAPKATELFDASTAYLWALARDSKGNLYAGGGPGAKLFQIAPDGSRKKLAEFDALEIHAIAVDAKDQVYVATSPDGKVYRVNSTGKSEEFYNPKQKYIWGMAFGPSRRPLHRYRRCGPGFTKSIATEKGACSSKRTRRTPGLSLSMLRETFWSERRRVAWSSGSLRRARVSCSTSWSSGRSLPLRRRWTEPFTRRGVSGGVSGALAIPIPQAIALGAGKLEIAAPSANRPMTSGGVDVYRIDSSGAPQKVWSNARDTVYAIAFDKQGRAVLATGNKGTLYRIDAPGLYTNLLSVTSSQITGLVVAPDGASYAIASNVGKVFRFGPELETQGAIESDVFDSGGFSQWGRLKAEGAGKIELFSRSGNVDRPQENWMGWASVKERVSSPAARFLQWKAVLQSGAELDSVEAAYLPKNVAPRVDEIESTPPNYRFSPPLTGLPVAAPSASITLPPIGGKAPGTGLSLDLGTSSMTLAKGWIGARWSASDDNGDTLIYTLEIRGEKEKEWRPLAAKIREKHYSFDSTAFPDGEYRPARDCLRFAQ